MAWPNRTWTKRTVAGGLSALAAAVSLASAATGQPTRANHAAVVARYASATCKSDYYKNVSGTCVHSPTSNPIGAIAKCRDQTYSYSQHVSGTCSHHGGVARWILHP